MAHRLSVNSRKKRFVNPRKIEVIRSGRMEKILGKSPAIFIGHQPPRAVYPYVIQIRSGLEDSDFQGAHKINHFNKTTGLFFFSVESFLIILVITALLTRTYKF